MAERKLAVVFTGDPKGAVRAMGDVEKAGGSMSSKLSKIGGGIATAFKGAAIGGAAIGGSLLVAGNALLTQGAQVEAWRQKTSVVFERQAGDVRKWADKNNEAFGLTDDELAGLAASFGDLLKPMGFTSAEAADMSTKVVGLSGALSSWSGGKVSSAEASDILAKAMLGERDGLKSLGISISEADVQARLAAKGQQNLTGAALEQAKAVATQELIFEKSTDAQKAWADGGNKALVGQNKLKAGFAEMKETLATALTPALATASGWIGDRLPGALEGAKRLFVSLQPTLETAGAWLRDKVPPAVERLRAAFDAAVVWVRANWPQIREVIASVLGAVQSVISSVVSISLTLWRNFGDNILSYVRAVWGPVQQVISGAMDIIRGIFATVSALLKGDWGAAWDGVKTIVSGAIEFVRGALGMFVEAVKLWLGIIVEILSSIWSKAWDGFKSLVSAALSKVVEFLQGLPGRAVSALAALGSSLLSAFTSAWSLAWGGFKSLIGAMVNYFKGLPGNLVAGLGELGSKLLAVFTAGWRVVWDGPVGFKSQVAGMVDFFKGLPGKLGAALGGLADALSAPFRTAFRAIKDLWNDTVGGFGFSIPSWVPGDIGGKRFEIPRMHTGGVVPGGRATEVLRMLQGGEVVLDRNTVDRLAGARTGATAPAGGLTIQVMGHVLDGRHLGELAAEGLVAYARTQNRPILAGVV